MKAVAFLVKWIGFLIGFGAMFLVVMALAGPLGWPFELFSSWPYLVSSIGIVSALVSGFAGWQRMGMGIGGGALVLVALAMASPGDITRPKAPAFTPGNDQLIWGNAMRESENVKTLMSRTLGPNQPVLAIGEIPHGWDWQALPQRQSLNRVRAGERLIDIGVEGCASAKETFTKTSQRGDTVSKRVFAIKVACPNYTLFAVHLTNPLWQWGQRFVRRNQELSELALAIKAEKGPIVVIGDFNTAPNAVPFSAFMREAGVDHTSCGGRWLPTWRPVGWRGKFEDANPLTGIPIDHLFTRDVQVVSCTVGKDFGSDHLPLVVELKKPQP